MINIEVLVYDLSGASTLNVGHVECCTCTCVCNGSELAFRECHQNGSYGTHVVSVVSG